MVLFTTSSTTKNVGDKPRWGALLLPGIRSHHNARQVLCKWHQSPALPGWVELVRILQAFSFICGTSASYIT